MDEGMEERLGGGAEGRIGRGGVGIVLSLPLVLAG